MKKPERSNYTPVDFLEWSDSNTLVLSPKFQRRGVWATPARSSFIETLIEGYPVPPIYLRVSQNKERTRTIREVVDGQQRLRAVLDFIAGKYSLSRTIESPYAGKRFEALADDDQAAILEYSFNTEVLYGISDAEVLEIFSRLNRYSVRLNNQELLNGLYFGRFKKTCYGLAYEHLEFWRGHRIFTENGVARMLEVQLVSELVIAQIAGLQDKKSSIKDFYEDFDEEFPHKARVERQFRSTMDQISDAVGDVLRESEFHRPPLFYSLFTAVFHHTVGLPETALPTPERRLNRDELVGLRDATAKLSNMILAGRQDQAVPRKYQQFVNSCLRQTDNLQPRAVRLDILYREAFE